MSTRLQISLYLFLDLYQHSHPILVGMAIIYVRTGVQGANRLRSTAGTQAEKRHTLCVAGYDDYA